MVEVYRFELGNGDEHRGGYSIRYKEFLKYKGGFFFMFYRL
jgi:hypothetical protein